MKFILTYNPFIWLNLNDEWLEYSIPWFLESNLRPKSLNEIFEILCNKKCRTSNDAEFNNISGNHDGTGYHPSYTNLHPDYSYDVLADCVWYNIL